MKKEFIKDMAGVIIFFMLLVFGAMAMNARVEQINNNSVVSLGE